MKATCALAVALATALGMHVTTHSQAQTPAPDAGRPGRAAVAPADRVFEVASIRLNKSGADGASVRVQPGGRLTVTNNSVRNIVRNAYNVQNFQIVGGPDWINTDRWDIVAKAQDDAAAPQLIIMLRNLLADRLKLVVHTEMRETPVYALVLARSDGRFGPQLRRSTVDCAALLASFKEKKETPPNTINGRPSCGTRTQAGTMMTTATTMADLVRNLAPMAGRPIVDRSGLTGAFDIDLTWAPDQQPFDSAQGRGAPGTAPVPDGDRPSLVTAVQEQLGLKLESQRLPFETLVIDSVERLTED
jgi:uncharacterized protein (TIGR03435 family)